MKLLTLARDLRRRKARERQGLFVAEGVRTVEELLRSPLEVRGALIGPPHGDEERRTALIDAIRHRGIVMEEVGTGEFDSAADTDAPQGILAIGVVPERTLARLPMQGSEPLRLLILDALQDPGNVGTIVRTAAAFGVSATICLPGTVDLWNAKVVRSAVGAQFHHSCLVSTWDELDSFRRERPFAIWAADASGDSIDGVRPPSRLALVVGNEGAGLSAPSRARAERLVALPLSAMVESLNVAVAAGILLYELRQ
jgi:RNA methyltransferase, TrmH family